MAKTNQLRKSVVQKVGAAVPKIKFTTFRVEENCWENEDNTVIVVLTCRQWKFG